MMAVVAPNQNNVLREQLKNKQFNPANPAAYKSTALVNTVAPAITGTLAHPGPLACSTGTYTGQVPYAYNYEWWSPAGKVQTGTSASYTTGVPDEGSVYCIVTAYGTGDFVTVKTAAVTVT